MAAGVTVQRVSDQEATQRDDAMERGRDGILSAYAQDLSNIRRQAAELRVENRKMLEQVRALQTTPRSPHTCTLR
jgi:hypothetical protein